MIAGMYDELRFFLVLAASAGFFGGLAALFGALTAYFKARDGQGSGTRLGHGVADAFDRAGDAPMPPLARALLVGGVDGFVFGAVVGLGIGAWCKGDWERLRPILGGGLGLVLAALAFGLAGRALQGAGTGVLLGLSAGGVLGAFAGFFIGGIDGLMVGVLAGAVIGSVLGVDTRRRPPRELDDEAGHH